MVTSATPTLVIMDDEVTVATSGSMSRSTWKSITVVTSRVNFEVEVVTEVKVAMEVNRYTGTDNRDASTGWPPLIYTNIIRK
jgi:hypothetical protein